MTSNLTGTVAVVTGAANGIGLASAAAFARRGAHVVFVDRDADALDQAVERPGGTAVTADVSSDEDMMRVADTAIRIGPVSVVMANAGIAIGGRFESIPIAEWTKILDVNVIGVVRTVQPFVDLLRRQAQGAIVVTGSSAGLFSTPGGADSPYAASKYALLGLARSLARSLEDSGVTVHYLAPRLTDTAFPRASIGWGRSGPRTTDDRSLDGADSVDTVVDALLVGMEERRFLISLTADTEARLSEFARTQRP